MAEDRKQDEKKSFIGRWSRRKREAARNDDIADPVEPTAAATEKVHVRSEDGTALEREALEREEIEMANRAAAEAVDIENLTYESDFSLFLKSGVPAALKRTAMRKLWMSNPVLANLDGLNDYDEDFNNPAHNVFQSIWQVGRGYLTSGELEAQQMPRQKLDEVKEDAEAVSETEQVAENSIGAESDDAQGAAEATIPDASDNADQEMLEEAPVRRVSIRRRLEG